MASTYSTLLRIELIGTGDQSGTWGSTTNVNLGTLIEQAIAGTTSIDVTAGNVTLTNYNGTSDQARCAAIRVTGTPGASRNIVAPASSKLYVVANGSNNAVVLKTSTSTGLTIPTGEVVLAYYDPTVGTADFRLVGRSSASTNTANTLVLRDAAGSFSAGTITASSFVGPLTGNVAGTLTGSIASTTTAVTQTAGDNTTKVATTAYVKTATDNLALGTMSTQNANSVNISGGTITGLSAALPVASGGTGTTTSTGSGSNVLSNSPTLVTPNLGTPSTVVLTNASGTANALNAGLGVNQTWTNPSNSHGTSYQNTTGKPIMVNYGGLSGAKNVWVYLQVSTDNVNWVTVAQAFTSYDDDINGGSLSAIVPNGSYYRSAGTAWGGALWSVLS